MPDKFPVIEPEDVKTFMESGKGNPRRTKEVLGVLAYLHRNAAFREAFESEIGQELLKDALERMEELHIKLIEHTEEIEERVEFDFLLKHVRKQSSKIRGYLNQVNKIKENK